MNSIRIFLFVLSLFIPTFLSPEEAQSIAAEQAKDAHNALLEASPEPTIKRPRTKKKKSSHLINFYFDNEELIDIINYLAGERGVNIVLPMGAQSINARVTVHIEDKISLDDAWDLLYTLIDLSGYSLIAAENMYRIVKTGKEVIKEPLPLYIVKPNEIPDNDKRIRYIYYFKNIKINDDQNNEMLALLKDVLPENTSFYRLDSGTNSIIISDKANNIKSLMTIVAAFDQVESQERPEIIKLRYLSPEFVAKLFNEQILAVTPDINPVRPDNRKTNSSGYFSKKMRIVPDVRNNAIIVFGRPQAIDRVRDFIQKHIDVELESGKSILHTYQLQYLDAKEFQPVLEAIVRSTRPGGTEQSKAGSTIGGTERYFEDVIIRADYPKTISGQQPGGAMLGSNNLIIAARNDDWERIKKLIEELDTPQPQVIIEVLIADLTLVDQRVLGTSLRNPLGTGLASNVNFQSAQFTPVITNSVTNPTTLAADLLRRGFDSATGSLTANCDNPTVAQTTCVSAAAPQLNLVSAGTSLISFNDQGTGQTWGLMQILKAVDNKKVLSHPHVITTNNKPAEIFIREEKLLVDEGSGSTGGTTTQTRKWVPADLKVQITPRISSGGMVNLQVTIDINQFANQNITFDNATAGDRVTRNVTTNANVRSGNILALGGLTRTDNTTTQNQTPLLSRIPLIGWFFKNRNTETDKNNLTVFISPIIVEPRLRSGVSQYTKEYVQLAKSYAKDGMLFDSLRDPITRWFFAPQAESVDVPIDEFVAQDEYIGQTIFDSRREEKKYVTHADQKNESSTDKKSGDLKSMMNDLNENPFTRI